MKVLFTYPTNSDFAPWEVDFVSTLQEEIRAYGEGNYEITDCAERADLVVLLESQTWKDRHHSLRLEREQCLITACQKVATINYEDSPAGYLRGVYSSLAPSKFDPQIHKSWPLLFLPNWEIYNIAEKEMRNRPAKFIFSFAGGISHPFRRRLLDRFRGERNGYKVIEVKPCKEYSSSQRQAFITDILDSEFVLCPRGAAPYSHRIPEVMALGRVPVIIADEWIPFSIPENDYYIRVREADVGRVAEILQSYRSEAAARGEHALEVWQKYFGRTSRAKAVVNALMQLGGAEAMTLERYRRLWSSHQFKKLNGWTPLGLALKRIRRRMKQFGVSIP